MITVEPDHFAYLKLQRGAISDGAGNFDGWLSAYRSSLRDDFESLRPHLPARCDRALDVGSGLGGIDVLIDRHYGGVQVRLLDGENDPAEMRNHDETFNSMAAALDFQRRNGVKDCATYEAGGVQGKSREKLFRSNDPSAFDLIVSLQAWCFHFAPETYLGFVRAMCRIGTVLIVDVRHDKPLWRQTLEKMFTFKACALSRRKFDRLVFHAA